MLVEGVTVEHRDSEGRIRGAQVQVIDFDISTSNDWLPVNQFTVTEKTYRLTEDLWKPVRPNSNRLVRVGRDATLESVLSVVRRHSSDVVVQHMIPE